MYIRQWLQESLQARTCQMIIHETMWELDVKPKTIENKVVDNFYEQILEYKFDEELEFRFMQCLQTLGTKIVPLDEILAVFGVQSPTIQNMICGDGTIKKGLDDNAAHNVFCVLQNLVRDKYATTV